MSFVKSPLTREIDLTILRTPELDNGIKINDEFIQLMFNEAAIGASILIIPDEDISGKSEIRLYNRDSLKSGSINKKFKGARIYNEAQTGNGKYTIHYDTFFELGSIVADASVVISPPSIFGDINYVGLVADTPTLLIAASTYSRKINIQNRAYNLNYGNASLADSSNGFLISPNEFRTIETKAEIWVVGDLGETPDFTWNEEE